MVYETDGADAMMKKLLTKFSKCQSGATAIEYGFIAVSIALVIIVAVVSIGSGLVGVFGDVNSGF